MGGADAESSSATVAGGGVCATERDTQSVRDLFRRVGDKWSLNVVAELSPDPVRFMVLLQRIDGISHRLLAKTLKSLERDGLLTRVAYPEVPPRVEYALSPLGESLLKPVLALADWAERHRVEVDAHRDSYDVRQRASTRPDSQAPPAER